jgi:hypothetical protein
MTKSIAPPSRYWAVQKQGVTVQRHETVVDDLNSVTFVIPNSCDTEQMSESELRQATQETSILSDRERAILGV